MSQHHKSNDAKSADLVASKFANANRKGPQYTCILCDEVLGPTKIWIHFKTVHIPMQDLGSKENEDKLRQEFLEDASHLAQNKSSRDALASRWAPKPTAKDVEELEAPTSPTRSSKAPAPASNDLQGKAFEKSSLEQDKSMQVNPLKRRPERSDTEHITPSRQAPPKARHSKALSGGVLPSSDPEYRRQSITGNDPAKGEVPRPRLFDHTMDDSNAKSTPRKGKQHGPGHRHQLSAGDRQSAPTVQNVRGRKKTMSESGRQPRLKEFATGGILQPKAASRTSHVDANQSHLNLEDGEPKSESMYREPDPEPFRQPETRPISHDQLVVEVKGIYAGLVLVEAKCIDVDQKQTQLAQEKDPAERRQLKDDQWQSLIALHKQLLHEHHDFFLASQHPSASTNLRKLAAKYSIPARMWRHGIHAFLEVLRFRLPESLEHMLAFIYIAYSMMALLYETVPTFEDTWIECLGDLGRYRMAIEDDEPRDREVWSGVARYWYSKASDRNPSVGRLYHHLAILARPYTLIQLSLYTRALTCSTPFTNAKGSVMTLFNPALMEREAAFQRVHALERLTITAHALLFVYPDRTISEFNMVLHQIKDGSLDNFIEQSGNSFKQNGVHYVVSAISALFEFGALTEEGHQRSALRRAYLKAKIDESNAKLEAKASAMDIEPDEHQQQELEPELLPLPELGKDNDDISNIVLTRASNLAFPTFNIILSEKHWKSGNTLPAAHVIFIFVCSVVSIDEAMSKLEARIPWESMCRYANYMASLSQSSMSAAWESKFPTASGASGRPPPEDYITRGQVYTETFFPKNWFSDAQVDEEERMLEQASNDEYRRLRILWLTARICYFKKWIYYDVEKGLFLPTKYTKETLLPFPLVLDDPKTGAGSQKTTNESVNANTGLAKDATMSDPPVAPTNENSLQISLRSSQGSITTGSMDVISSKVAGEAPLDTVQQTPLTPKIVTIDEPQDIPMVDLSPVRDSSSPLKDPASQEERVWLKGAVMDPGTSPPRKSPAHLYDERRVKIVSGDEIPGEQDI